MPYSLVLNLLPQSPIPPGYLSGKHLHALFLTLVSSVDWELGERLHEQKTEKAFTLSPLQVSQPRQTGSIKGRDYTLQWQHKQAIPAGTPCWWRISLLDDALFGNLTQLWLNLNPAHPWHLGPADLKITTIIGSRQSTQPWANFCTYQQLYDQASDSDRQISFTFCTPTTFRQRDHDSALPTRDSVFNSLIKRWNNYSNIEISETIVPAIFPSYFDIRTEIVTEQRSKFIGCIGNISYKILTDIEPTLIKQINALADFALYSGIGRKTPMGMGMVRRLFSS
jgi:CRISPR-associated endoribonuclease Cas6